VQESARAVFTASGELEAQQVRAFLDAEGIASFTRGEALRNTHGLTLNGLGRVEILVAEADEARARELLAAADAGQFRLDDDADTLSS
jgi:non-ribosomal peptide synthetase component E (peptide arylation enzyme)